MEKHSILRDVTNLQIVNRQKDTKQNNEALEISQVKQSLTKIIFVDCQQLDFGYCIPGIIYQKIFAVVLLQQLQQQKDIIFNIACQDKKLFDSQLITVEIKKLQQQQYLKTNMIKIKSRPLLYQIKIKINTPMYNQYDTLNYINIYCQNYLPIVIKLKQKIQIPQIICLKQLFISDSRVIKLSFIQNRSKKQCKVPFKLNHPMVISISAEVIGLIEQFYPLIDVKPKVMTLAGKGQFSLVFTINTDDEIKQTLQFGLTKVVRRILTLKIKDTKLIYHFPIEVTYCPEISIHTIAQLC